MRIRPLVCTLLLAAGLVPGRPLGAAPASPADGAKTGARTLIARVVEAYGGRAALARVRAYRLEGTLFSSMRHTESPTVRVFERPDRLKVRIAYANGAELRLVAGGRGWRNEGGGPVEPVQGPMLDAMVLQAARAAVPWILMEHEAEARTIEVTDIGGVRAPGVEVPLGEGLAFRAWIDPASARVLRSQGVLERGAMRTHFETNYSDFHRVNGVWFAFDEENWASGAPTGHTSVTRVTLNPKLARDEFAPPAGGTPGRRRSGS